LSESEKTWKDSNWYVSLTGFWAEYKKHRMGIIGIIVVILFFGMAIFAPNLSTHDPNPQAKVAPAYLAPSWLSVFDPTGVVTGELLEDPMITQEPFIGVNGSSSEFSGLHQPITENNNQSYVNLTWTHTPGTSLDYVGYDPQDPYPDYNDFVYLDQEFTWDYNNRTGLTR
jgi:hypothetical protein